MLIIIIIINQITATANNSISMTRKNMLLRTVNKQSWHQLPQQKPGVNQPSRLYA